MVINGLGFVSRALYLTPSFFRAKALHALIRESITPEDLTRQSRKSNLSKMGEAVV